MTATATIKHGPSTHLSWRELACHDGTPYPAEWVVERALPLAEAFEDVRAACGGLPIRVLSAFRTTEHNRKVGGARTSQHVQGRALDLCPPGEMSVDAFHDIILRVARTPGSRIRGIGKYRTFVHLDIRPSDRLSRWTGSGVS